MKLELLTKLTYCLKHTTVISKITFWYKHFTHTLIFCNKIKRTFLSSMTMFLQHTAVMALISIDERNNSYKTYYLHFL